MNSKNSSLAVLSIVLLLISLISCDKDSQPGISYALDIQPIFNLRCTSCHGSPGINDLNLSSFETLMEGNSVNGPVVIPYDADNSILYDVVANDQPASVSSRMPDGETPLNDTQINLIEDWINEGAKDN